MSTVALVDKTLAVQEQSRANRLWRSAALIFALAIFCFTFRLGDAPLARTEGHRVITAHQMLESGDYLVPRLYGHVYLRKPPLQYWVLAASERVVGQSEFANRLPSALAMALLATLVCVMTTRWFDESLAGLVAGVLCIGIVPLWSQARAADIDALNTLVSVAASLAIIEVGWRRADWKASIWMILLGGIGFGASLLAKGPAGLPIIVGAMIGPAIACRIWRPLKSGKIYLSLLIGCVMFVGWILAVLAVAGTAPAEADSSGLKEAQFKFYIASLQQLKETLTMPFLVLAFGFPLTLTLVFPFLLRRCIGFSSQGIAPPDATANSQRILDYRSPAWAQDPARESLFIFVLEPTLRELIRAIGGTILTAFALQFITGTGNPRYAYLNLPLFCPLAGGIAYAWRRKLLPQSLQKHAPGLLPVLAILYGAVAIVMFVLSRRDGLDRTMIFGGVGLAVLIGVSGLMAAINGRLRISGWMATAAMCMAIIAFGIQKNGERTRASAFSVASQLRSAVTDANAYIGTANVVWAEPEIFYYAGLKPQVLPSLLNAHAALPSEDSWFVMDAEEWQSWEQAKSSTIRLSMVRELRLFNKNLVYVCWYSPTGNPPPAAIAAE